MKGTFMPVGIEKTLATIAGLQELATDGIRLVKKGAWGLGSLGSLLEILSDVRVLSVDAVHVLPELADLDAAETGKIGTAAFNLVKAVVAAVVA